MQYRLSGKFSIRLDSKKHYRNANPIQNFCIGVRSENDKTCRPEIIQQKSTNLNLLIVSSERFLFSDF